MGQEQGKLLTESKILNESQVLITGSVRHNVFKKFSKKIVLDVGIRGIKRYESKQKFNVKHVIVASSNTKLLQLFKADDQEFNA